MVPVLVEKEFLDMKQNEKRIKFIRGGAGGGRSSQHPPKVTLTSVKPPTPVGCPAIQYWHYSELVQISQFKDSEAQD